MLITPGLQRQHQEILQICDNVLNTLPLLKSKTNVAETKKKIHSLMNSLFGKLLVHVSMEDKVLYPEALNAKDDSLLCTKALEMMREMAHLKDRAVVYRESLILKEENDIDKFISETTILVEALQKNINREEKELYPLFFKHKERRKQSLLLQRAA